MFEMNNGDNTDERTITSRRKCQPSRSALGDLLEDILNRKKENICLAIVTGI